MFPKRRNYEGCDFSLSDLRLIASDFVPSITANFENTITRSGAVYDLDLKTGDVLTIRRSGGGSRSQRQLGPMKMDEGSAIQFSRKRGLFHRMGEWKIIHSWQGPGIEQK